jgi:hypothetical protein
MRMTAKGEAGQNGNEESFASRSRVATASGGTSFVIVETVW